MVIVDVLSRTPQPLFDILLVMMYKPGLLALKLISPVVSSTKTNPAGDDVNDPALEPAGKIGTGLGPLVQ